jgi:hypothetical protein
MSFNEGDKVKVLTKNSIHEGKTGGVTRVFSDEKTCTVQLDGDPVGLVVGFFFSELELVDVEREALIELAETLDKARLQANAIPAMAPQSGVYGDVSEALKRALAYEFGVWVANKIYASLLDGNTVREAIAAVVKK